MVLDLLTLLGRIPSVVWSGIMASIITLLGVMLSNRGQSKRLLLQLEKDEQRRRNELIGSLRRDVYLKAVEDLIGLNSHLGKLSGLKPVGDSIAAGFNPFMTSAAKLQLICEPETARICGELTAGYGELLPFLLKNLQSVFDEQIEIEITTQQYERAKLEADRILSAITLQRESGSARLAVLHELQRSFEYSTKEMSEFSARRQLAWTAHNLSQLNYTKNLLPKLKELGELQVPFTVAIRKELHLEGDIAAFQLQAELGWKRMSRSMDETLAFLEGLNKE